MSNKIDGLDIFNADGSEGIQKAISASVEWTSTERTPFITVEELLNQKMDEISFVVEGLLPVGGTSLIAAKPKVGKTTLNQKLALCVAKGEPFLGRKTKQGPVLALYLEEKPRYIKQHLQTLGAKAEDPIHFLFHLDPKNSLQMLETEIKRVSPVLVIVDPLVCFVSIKDGNSYTGVYEALTPIVAMARATNTHILLTTHMGKGERQDASDAVIGSTAYFAAVDTAILLATKGSARSISTKQRYGENLKETILLFDRDQMSLSLGESCEARGVASSSREILTFLENSSLPVSREKLEDAVGGRTEHFRNALNSLFALGKIGRSGNGVKNDPHYYHSIESSIPVPCNSLKQETGKEALPLHVEPKKDSCSLGMRAIPVPEGGV